MTNFAKRSMLERDMASNIPTAVREGNLTGDRLDDEYEPLRPSMRGNSDEGAYEDGPKHDGYGEEVVHSSA